MMPTLILGYTTDIRRPMHVGKRQVICVALNSAKNLAELGQDNSITVDPRKPRRLLVMLPLIILPTHKGSIAGRFDLPDAVVLQVESVDHGRRRPLVGALGAVAQPADDVDILFAAGLVFVVRSPVEECSGGKCREGSCICRSHELWQSS